MYNSQQFGNLVRRLTANASGFTPFSIMEMHMDTVFRSRWQFCSVWQLLASLHAAFTSRVLGFDWRTRMVEISCRISTACCAAACLSLLGILCCWCGFWCRAVRLTVPSRGEEHALVQGSGIEWWGTQVLGHPKGTIPYNYNIT